ncbi:hypothetical protein BDY21DRAFT_412575 [Lineolata rhizophorae]|uniref:Transglutaminase-like domain-containing protein n=1 Tax=Lineolata rhizophorae TaxID=578093 RepID=A0A6A6PDS3_9PEZI|nr:hypothetical protein BDY21DRAFT_412575 [Lineolata rhizophorae]
MAEDSTPMTSIRARIAALNIDQVGAHPSTTSPPPSYDQAVATKKTRPPPPPPPAAKRADSTPNAPASTNRIGNQPDGGTTPRRDVLSAPGLNRSTTGSSTNSASAPAPALPPRPAKSPRVEAAAPALPPRRPSAQLSTNGGGGLDVRRGSIESASSTVSGQSWVSSNGTSTGSTGSTQRVKAPPFDPSKLPPLPPKRTQTSGEQNETKANGRAPLKPTISSPALRKASYTAAEKVRERSPPPPSLPSRPALPARKSTTEQQQAAQPPRRLPPRSALSWGMNKSTEEAPSIPTARPGQIPDVSQQGADGTGAPPPVPFASRPNLDAINASKPKVGAGGETTSCLKCRDFSAADAHAARFPRESIPSTDVGWLSQQLTAPFASATDKARAIFTWLHHNIAYDYENFFAGTVRGSTPAGTVASGKAVCEGYAGLFAALALPAGLEAMVVGGHGKGYSHKALAPGSPAPPFAGNHAWNAVRIDGGEWKLIDACWGAGHIRGPEKGGPGYTKRFAPNMFTADNIEFGERHFPEDPTKFFRLDGRTPAWEEYILADVGADGDGTQPTMFGSPSSDHGLDQRSFLPACKRVKTYDPSGPAVVRFQFTKVCRHWDPVRNGKGAPYLMTLSVGGRDGRKKQYVPFEQSPDGFYWYLDVPRAELGAPGERIGVYAVTSFDGRDGRGLSAQEFKQKTGRCMRDLRRPA